MTQYTSYVIYWDDLTISTPTSNGPQPIKRMERMHRGWFARFGTHDFALVSYEDAIRACLALVEPSATAADYGMGEGLER